MCIRDREGGGNQGRDGGELICAIDSVMCISNSKQGPGKFDGRRGGWGFGGLGAFVHIYYRNNYNF